jgi:hypothetical protein
VKLARPVLLELRMRPHHRVLDYLMCGWHILVPDAGMHRVGYSVILAWLCDCKIVEPLE